MKKNEQVKRKRKYEALNKKLDFNKKMIAVSKKRVCKNFYASFNFNNSLILGHFTNFLNLLVTL